MSTYPEKFEEFWKAYPRKVSKLAAGKAWEKQGVEDDLYLAKAAIDDVKKRSRLGWWSKDRSKIPHPATWINARRWEDEGWEDEVGHADGHQPVNTRYKVPEEPARPWPWYEVVLNRLGRNYIMASGGLPDTDQLVNIRDRILHRDVPAFVEDIEAGTLKVRDASLQVGDLFLRHLDHAYKLTIAGQVYSRSLQP